MGGSPESLEQQIGSKSINFGLRRATVSLSPTETLLCYPHRGGEGAEIKVVLGYRDETEITREPTLREVICTIGAARNYLQRTGPDSYYDTVVDLIAGCAKVAKKMITAQQEEINAARTMLDKLLPPH